VSYTLQRLGWRPELEAAFAPMEDSGLIPARVSSQHRDAYELLTTGGALRGITTGRLHYLAAGPSDLPAVGDWVAARPLPGEPAASIQEILPRSSCFLRRAAGDRDTEQVIAANVDRLFLVSGLDLEFNRRRIERYLTAAARSGAEPVLVLNKADLCEDPDPLLEEAREAAQGRTVLLVSASEGEGIEAMRALLPVGVTGAMAGSSGVGKTTLLNALVGAERGATAEVRASDSHGRHTTTRRELILLPDGGMLIDTPGMREIQLWGGTDGVDAAFEDIAALSDGCRFRDCTHTAEPGCAVIEAVADGRLGQDRLDNYHKLSREAARQELLQDKRAQREEERKFGRIMYNYRKGPHKRTDR
jgi:ribosome biogenesis GTPase